VVQGKLAGSTSYEDQNCEEIKKDIENWSEYARKINKEITERKTDLENIGYWDSVPYNFEQTVLNTIHITDTFMKDFKLISTSIEKGFITEKEVKLLKKIGNKAKKLNVEYGQTYKEDIFWPDHEDPNFPEINKIYTEGRDFFASLQDATNAAHRLEDYVSHNSISNNVNISGDKNSLNIQQGNGNNMNISGKEKSEILEKLDYLLDNLGTLVSDNVEKEVQESLEFIKEEVDSPSPKKSLVDTIIRKLQLIGGATEFAAAVTEIADFFASF